MPQGLKCFRQTESGASVLLQHQSDLAEETVVRTGNSKHPLPFIMIRAGSWMILSETQ